MLLLYDISLQLVITLEILLELISPLLTPIPLKKSLHDFWGISECTYQWVIQKQNHSQSHPHEIMKVFPSRENQIADVNTVIFQYRWSEGGYSRSPPPKNIKI